MNDEEQLQQAARDLFEQREQGMDAQWQSRLHRSRSEALAGRSRSWSFTRGWMPAGAALTAVLLVSAVLLLPQTQPQQPLPPIAELSEEDVQLLAETTDIELLEELDFYLWLDAQEDLTS